MAIFPEDVSGALNALEKEKLTAKEFEQGLTLQIVSVEKVQSQWGAGEEDRIVEKGILEEGQQFKYTFKDSEGLTRTMYSTSLPLAVAMQRAEINYGDWLRIKREGKGTTTKYIVEKVV